MIFRYSIPTFSVCTPFVHVSESLMMNVGRVVTLPMLMPALVPNCANPSLNDICGGTLYPATPAIFGKSSTKLWFTEPYPSFRFRYPMDMWFSRLLVKVRSQLSRLTHEFCGSEYDSLAIGCGSTDTNFAGARWCQTLVKM